MNGSPRQYTMNKDETSILGVMAGSESILTIAGQGYTIRSGVGEKLVIGLGQTLNMNDVKVESAEANVIENSGKLNFVGGTTSLNRGIIGSGDMSISEGAVLEMTDGSSITENKVSVSGSLKMSELGKINGTLEISESGDASMSGNGVTSNVSNAGSLELRGGTLAKAVNGTGTTTVSGSMTNAGGINQAVVVNSGVTLTNNASLGSNTGTITNAGTINGNFAEDGILDTNLRFDIVYLGNGKFKIMNTHAITDFNLNRNNTATGTAIEAGSFVKGSPLDKLRNTLNELSQHNLGKYQKTLTNIAPMDNQLAIADIIDTNEAINHQLMTPKECVMQLSEDGTFHCNHIWMNAIGAKSKQDSSYENTGFDVHRYGYMFGADGKYTTNTRLGFGYAYHTTKGDSDERDIEAKGHTMFVYGKYQPERNYIRGLASYTTSKYTEKSQVDTVSMNSKYKVQGVGLEAYVGHEGYNGLNPEIGLRYNYIEKDKYMDSFMQDIKTKDINLLTLVTTLQYRRDYMIGETLLRPDVYIGATYDAVSNDIKSVVRLGQNNAPYTINGKRLSRFGINGGINLNIDMGGWELIFGYDMSIKKGMSTHTGTADLKYHF